MIQKNINQKSKLRINKSVEGETIEEKMGRITNNKEPIKDGAPLIYTERKEGVRPSTDIRTDRWEIAIEATEAIARSQKAKREEKPKGEEIGKTEPIQGKGSEQPTPTDNNK